MKNPCKTCDGYPSDCFCCERKIKYDSYLESNRIFTKDEPITTFDEFLKEEWVFMYGKPKHRGFTHSQQFRTIKILLKSNGIHYAIRKGSQDE